MQLWIDSTDRRTFAFFVALKGGLGHRIQVQVQPDPIQVTPRHWCLMYLHSTVMLTVRMECNRQTTRKTKRMKKIKFEVHFVWILSWCWKEVWGYQTKDDRFEKEFKSRIGTWILILKMKFAIEYCSEKLSMCPMKIAMYIAHKFIRFIIIFLLLSCRVKR